MRLTPEQVAETRAAMVAHTHPDGRPNAEQIARALNLSPSTVKNRLYRLSSTKFTPVYQETVKPRVRVPYRTQPVNRSVEDGEAIRVCYVTDTHYHPGDNPERLRWVARHIGETQPDRIRHGGDFCDYDSVSTHDPVGSIKAKTKPSLAADMEANEEALYVFDKELGPSTIPRDFDCGNHEERLKRYETLRGELDGSLWFRIQELYARYRWRFHEYGTINFCGGVGFTHIPQAANGNPYGSPAIILRDLTHDLVCGHTHKGGDYPMAKIGGGVTLYNGGCSLPHGVVKDYAKLNPTHWRYGINEITISSGKVTGFSFISMLELQRRYA